MIQKDSLAKQLGDNFKLVGDCLGLNPTTLSDLNEQHQNQLYERNYQMIMRWQKSNGKCGTLELMLSQFQGHGLHYDIPKFKLDQIYTYKDENQVSREDQRILSRQLMDDYTRFLRLLGVSEETISEIILSKDRPYEKTHHGIERWKNATIKAERTRGRVISVLLYIERKDIIEKLNKDK